MTSTTSPQRSRARASYRFTALGRAAIVMWRGWAVIIAVVIGNAAVQSLISAAPYSPDQVALNVVSAAVSAVAFVVSIALLIATAVSSVDGSTSWRTVLAVLRQRRTAIVMWTLLVGLAAIIGFALWTIPGFAVLALSPFVGIAAATGATNPLRANFVTIRARFWRWLVTTFIVLVLALLGYVVFGFVLFFLRGVLGASIIWLVIGLAFAWILTAWALVFDGAQD